MISWFSNGAASAVATQMMIDAGHDVRIIRTLDLGIPSCDFLCGEVV